MGAFRDHSASVRAREAQGEKSPLTVINGSNGESTTPIKHKKLNEQRLSELSVKNISNVIAST